MSCSCTGNCDLININPLVLSDTFQTWYDRTNEIINAVNLIQVYDVNVGLTDGGLTEQSTCIGGNSNGVITLKVNPGPGIGVGTTVTPNYYLNRTMVDVSNMTALGATAYTDAVISNRPSAEFPANGDWYIVSDTRDSSLGSGAGTPKRIKAEHILPPTVYLPYGFQFNGDVSINGNLSIQGTQSTIDSNDLRVEDKMIEIAYHRLVSIDVTGPTYGNSFLTPGLTMYYYDPGVGNTAAYTTVGHVSDVTALGGGKTNIKLHKFIEGGVNDIVANGRLSVTGTNFDFTISAGPTTTEAYYSDVNLDEAGILVHGSDSDKTFLWVNSRDGSNYNAFLTNTNLGVSGDTKAVISSQFKAFGYGSTNQNNNKFHFVGNNGAAPTIRLGGLGTGSDQYGYWGVTRQNYGGTGPQQPLFFTFKPYAATGEFTSFTIWSGASGPTYGTNPNNVVNFAQGLNVDLLDGAHGATSPTAWAIPISSSDGKIDSGWIDSSAIVKCYTLASHGFSIGDVVRLNPDNGSLTGAIATSRQNAEVLGIVSRVTDANNVCVTTKGFVTGLTGSPTSNIAAILPLVTGNAYFLSADNQGRMIANPDVGIEFGEVRKPILVAMGPNSAYVHNYLGVVEGDPTDIVDVQGVNPIGTIMPWSGMTGSIPYGWLPCDGSRLEKSLWGELYDIIGQNYYNEAQVNTSWNGVGDAQFDFVLEETVVGGGKRGLQVDDALLLEDALGNSYEVYVTAAPASPSYRFTVNLTAAQIDANSARSGTWKIRGRIAADGKRSIFFVPESRSRLFTGVYYTPSQNTTQKLGAKVGANNRTLLASQMPAHDHVVKKVEVQQGTGVVVAQGFDSTTSYASALALILGGNAQYTAQTQGAISFDNRSTAVSVNWIIRAKKGMSAMILSGHNHDDRYIRYDASQTVNSAGRTQFRTNAKVLRNDDSDTFNGDLSVTGNITSNLKVGSTSLNVTGSAVIGNATIRGDLQVTGGSISVVRNAVNFKPVGTYTPIVPSTGVWTDAGMYVVGGTANSTSINLFNNNSIPSADGYDSARINFFGISNPSLSDPRYSSSLGFALRGGPNQSDEYGASLGSNQYEHRIGFNIASGDGSVEDTGFIITRRSDAGTAVGSIRYRFPSVLPSSDGDGAATVVIDNTTGELKKLGKPNAKAFVALSWSINGVYTDASNDTYGQGLNDTVTLLSGVYNIWIAIQRENAADTNDNIQAAKAISVSSSQPLRIRRQANPSNGSVFGIWYSTDSGTTWTKIIEEGNAGTNAGFFGWAMKVG